VYDHTLVADDGHDSDRRAITAMGTDVEQAIKGLGDIHEIWACTIEMAFAIWLLTKQVAAASAVPVVICISTSEHTIAISDRILTSTSISTDLWSFVQRLGASYSCLERKSPDSTFCYISYA
jgi:ATP-binding cassette subfamily C (CFTR/MRP) protein 1